MVKNTEKWRDFEKKRIKEDPADLNRNFALLDALYEEARFLGVFPSRDPLEGIEFKVRIARTVNSVQRTD